MIDDIEANVQVFFDPLFEWVTLRQFEEVFSERV